ncbi:MAG TPA: radical SAM protein, partial [Candidatus Methanoperedenaceae archaeon]|nr:radical SAM protein [Candidatus Methanoperedenaceae archaeon]
PYVVCELETYRGCPRDAHCSFCTEPFYGAPDYRSVPDIVREVAALYDSGALYFRIGRQPDLFMYQAIDGSGGARPDPAAIESLYRGIRGAAPGLRVLHMDNANPATIYRFPEESLVIAKTIIRYHTPGDVAAFGMESADPAVIRANALKAEPDEVFESIRLINSVGAGRGANGMPELLPGLNFVHGLRAESGSTFKLNYEFLKRVLDSGLLLRRINIRQVMVFPGTGMASYAAHIKSKEFQRYKEKVRNDIDVPMLRRVVPAGTILRDVMTEVGNGVTYGRQLGSYPLLVGIPDRFPLGRTVDVVVTSHGSRSITGVPVPLNVNEASMKLISALPGMGKKRAAQVIRKRPFTGIDDFKSRVDGSSPAADYIGL